MSHDAIEHSEPTHWHPGWRIRQPGVPRQGMALCLSGGGYRAALFHLGAVRRLNELGVLPKVDTVSAVSGGSLLLAQLIK